MLKDRIRLIVLGKMGVLLGKVGEGTVLYQKHLYTENW